MPGELLRRAITLEKGGGGTMHSNRNPHECCEGEG